MFKFGVGVPGVGVVGLFGVTDFESKASIPKHEHKNKVETKTTVERIFFSIRELIDKPGPGLKMPSQLETRGLPIFVAKAR